MCARLSHPRSGNILVLTAFMIVGMMALLAFAIDLGYLYVAKTELQRSADSAAMVVAATAVSTGASASGAVGLEGFAGCPRGTSALVETQADMTNAREMPR